MTGPSILPSERFSAELSDVVRTHAPEAPAENDGPCN
jgi:hypothetical protein